MSADSKKYAQLWTDLNNSLTLGENRAFDVLAMYKSANNHGKNNQEAIRHERVTMAQVDACKEVLVPDMNGIMNHHTWCPNCNLKGHNEINCPVNNKVTMTNLLTYNIIPKLWILLGTASTISSIANIGLVQEVKDLAKSVRCYCCDITGIIYFITRFL